MAEPVGESKQASKQASQPEPELEPGTFQEDLATALLDFCSSLNGLGPKKLVLVVLWFWFSSCSLALVSLVVLALSFWWC